LGGGYLVTGRPSKYKPELIPIVKKMCELGATVPDIAEALEVAESSIRLWATQHEGFSAALRIGREPADDKVEVALYHRAIGYSHPDTDIRVIDGQIVQTQITKHYPPDTKAALAWLYNRRPDNWKPTPPEGAIDAVGQVIEIIRASRPN
jgi:hypothetical protein